MSFSSIKAGTVFRWAHDERPARVLVHADEIVMYDSWWPHLNAWGHANLREARRGATSYYATSASTVLAKANYLRDEPLTDEEEALHRPDLPFAVVRRPEISWPASAADLSGFIAAFETEDFALAAPDVCLEPFGPGGGTKRAIRVSADDKTRLPAAELLRKAAELQMPNLRDRSVVEGVGIYRSGLYGGRPSFYLWGAASKLGSVPSR
ncbi:hypothetical protein GCM10010168_61030 [Actinoplanes ianthinogenes]|uniref:Uncharacterized protein n=1 Tax=Actinoplanes ianthinogenes TaxID=122358 RepID=A0ABN6CQJ6_9ACTN|nr:hypothetical protein [Actinoplanes ianthinogenes]BCJ46464.1 hypothetical protein Aiant_71210 [Actinoplanes ianthinogenes]GGR34433.1 hypothetical protein GCM10010168_61030 [Actinoplanes ianthinogenes]